MITLIMISVFITIPQLTGSGLFLPYNGIIMTVNSMTIRTHHPRFVLEVVERVNRVYGRNSAVTKSKQKRSIVVVRVANVLPHQEEIGPECLRHLAQLSMGKVQRLIFILNLLKASH